MSAVIDTSTEYERHPLSALCGDMPQKELTELSEDIKKNGQLEPGVLYEGMVLDGWHRTLACDRVGVKCQYVEYTGDTPAQFVESKNAYRRNYQTPALRAQIIVALREWRAVGRPENRVPGTQLNSGSNTTAEMARSAGVSEATIKRAKVAESAGLGDVVRSGQVSGKAAAEIAKDPKLTKQVKQNKVTPIEAAEKIKQKQRDKRPRTSEIEKARVEIAGLLSELADLRLKNAELLTELEPYVDADAPELEQHKRFKALHKEIDVLRSQLADQVSKVAGLAKQNKYYVKELKKLGWE